MPIFRYENYNIDYEITQRRKNQKHIILRFRDGRLSVSAPKHATYLQIESVLKQNLNWIKSRNNQQTSQYPKDEIPHLLPTKVEILGRSFPIELCRIPSLLDKPSVNLSITKGELRILIPSSFEQSNLNTYVHHLVYQHLFSLANKAIPQTVLELSREHGLRPTRVIVKEQRSRWGSCSTNGSIYMNWRLIQAKEEVIRYVAVHELAHLKVHNHSNQFWNLVEKMMPDFSDHREWLKRNGDKLFYIRK